MTSKSNEVVFVPDLQILHEDEVFTNALIDYIIASQPKEVIFIGDTVDCTAPARWNKGTAQEFSGTLQKEFDQWADYASRLRSSYDGRVFVHYGNHEERIAKYIANYAPALSSLRAVGLSELMQLDQFGFEYGQDFHEFAPGWASTHGHLGGKLSAISGNTALGIAKETGVSIVCGHTHRLAITSYSIGYGGNLSTLHGVEVGHGMRELGASYMGGGVMNWQKGFACGMIIPSGFQPQIVKANADSTFYKDGTLYGKPAGQGNS